MIKVSIIGSGNVAQHLISAFKNANEIEVSQVFSRNKNDILLLIEDSKIVNNFNDLFPVDLIIIAVSDTAIESVSNQLLFENQLVVHTSGGISIEYLNDKNRKGVFYPLQSFSKNKALNFKEVPICLESETENDYQILEKVAQSISDNVFKINSLQRKSLHLSAVFVNNFVNHLYQIGNDICDENNVDFDILKPLILETAQKIMTITPNNAQTGPAKRNDLEVIEQHLNSITNENQRNIYKILTQSIQQNGEEL